MRKMLEWIGDKLRAARISLRLSVLSTVLLMVLSTAAVILWLVASAAYNNTIDSAKKLISVSSDRIVDQLNLYFMPLNSVHFATNRLLAEGMLKISDTERDDECLMRFIRSTVRENKNLSGAYYADRHGSFYIVNRLEDGGYYQMSVNRNKQIRAPYATQRWFDINGEAVSEAVPMEYKGDPRERVWYKQALRNVSSQPTVNWIRYKFSNLGRKSELVNGVTSILPLVDHEGRVYGVMGADILGSEVNKYLADLKLPEGAIAMIYNTSHTILWRHVFGDEKLTDREVYALPEVYGLLHNTEIDDDNTLTFKAGNGGWYIAATRHLKYVRDDMGWYVAVMTPMDALVRDVEINFLRAMLLAVSATLVGVIGAIRFAGSISHPINKLANDSNYMCDLNFDKVLYRPSIIKELDNMSRAFMNMRNALCSFGRYMPIGVVRQLIASGQVANVGGEKRELTLMFSDIRQFTDIAEGMQPEELMQYLSEYLQCVSSVIAKNHGTIDKYIGDSVMCFWGAPADDARHAIHACQTVLDVKKVVSRKREEWRLQGKPTIVTRFGVNTGAVVVGNVGSDERLNYTAIGDAVNLASRLEGINKMYGTTVAVGESTYQLAKDCFRFRKIDLVRVKGKSKPVYLYELIDEDHWLGQRVEAYSKEFEAAFVFYYNGDWAEALSAFEVLLAHYPEDNLAPVFVERCVKFMSKPPIVWDGVWDYHVK